MSNTVGCSHGKPPDPQAHTRRGAHPGQLEQQEEKHTTMRKEVQVMIIRRIGGLPAWEWRSPFGELDRMRREMDRLSEALTGPLFREPLAGVFPLMNVTEDPDNYYVLAEMPGVKAKDLAIDLRENTLTLTGEVESPEGEREEELLREYRTGNYYRQFTLSDAIDQSKIDASLKDGVLRLTLPKVEAVAPRTIPVKTG